MYILRHKRPGCTLALEDGSVFKGTSFGAEGGSAGEIVFNTGMTGYQEILTDPSYKGQVVAMTYPLIGNYGTNAEDIESVGPQVEGFVVREASRLASNWQNSLDLQQYLQKWGITAADDIDTRALTLRIREEGAMRAVLSTEGKSDDELVDMAKASPSMEGLNLAEKVTCPEAYDWDGQPEADGGTLKVVVYDFGVKRSILRNLARAGCAAMVVPADTAPEDVLEMRPDGVVLSNGPGDPGAVKCGIAAAKAVIGKVPVLGICLGHQIAGLALGGRTYKLKFGHHGSNHPVKNIADGRIEITAQNHGFCVDAESLKEHNVEITHMNLNDGTVEGLAMPELRLNTVQFHPEAGPGPHDAQGIFGRFAKLMRGETS